MTGIGPRLRIAAEMAAIFAMLAWLDWRLPGTFERVDPNPYWIPVVAMALAYGTGLGLAAALLASGLWLVTRWQPLTPGVEPFSYLLNMSLTPLLWVLGATIIGEVTAHRWRDRQRLMKDRSRLERQFALVADAFRKVDAVNRDLQVRVAAADNGVPDAMATAITLATAEPLTVQAAAARVIATALGQEDFTYYAIEGHAIRPVTRGTKATSVLRAIEGTPLAERLTGGTDLVRVEDADGKAILDELGVAALTVRSSDETAVGILLFHGLEDRARTRIGMLELADAARGVGDVFGSLSLPFLGAAPSAKGLVA